MFRSICFIIIALAASGCTPTIHADAIRFHDGLEVSANKSFAIVAEGKQHNNLEFNHFAQMVNAKLQQNGLRQSSSLEAADYRVYFSYGSDGGKHYVRSAPDYGFHGGIGTYGSGVGLGVGGTFYDPYYRRNRVDSFIVYTYYLTLRIEAEPSKQQVFNGEITASGDTTSLVGVMPCMVEAMFKEFPGPNGVQQRISLPREGCQQGVISAR
ncbi:MAG: DUF4136 domain-containing protein [Alphaproteobacteria bacterium]|nr:DUF4136 domain-containing protein [Alphaproteobacteria bacterium]